MGPGRIHFASITTAAAWAEREGKKVKQLPKKDFIKKVRGQKQSKMSGDSQWTLWAGLSFELPYTLHQMLPHKYFSQICIRDSHITTEHILVWGFRLLLEAEGWYQEEITYVCGSVCKDVQMNTRYVRWSRNQIWRSLRIMKSRWLILAT